MTESRRPITRELLDSLGFGRNPLPPDDEVYQQGPVVLFSDPPTPAQEPEDWRAELEAMGINTTPLPPDHWVYRQGTAFIFDEPTESDS